MTRMAPGYRYFSYLPLAHIFEMALEVTVLTNGGQIYYYTGMANLAKDLPKARPSGFAAVPRIYQKFYDRISDKVTQMSGLKGFLARQAFEGQLVNAAKDNLAGWMAAIYDR